MNHNRRRRPYTRPATDRKERAIQLAISRKHPRPAPKIREKHLVDGKWTRDWADVLLPKTMAEKMADLRAKIATQNPGG